MLSLMAIASLGGSQAVGGRNPSSVLLLPKSARTSDMGMSMSKKSGGLPSKIAWLSEMGESSLP